VLFSSIYNLFALLGRKVTFTHSLTHSNDIYIVYLNNLEDCLNNVLKITHGILNNGLVDLQNISIKKKNDQLDLNP